MADTNNTKLLREKEEHFKKTKLAAERGDIEAQQTLGLLYYNKQNFSEAAKWFLLVAKKGKLSSYVCCYYFGNMYACGYGVKQNSVEAIKYFQKASASSVLTFAYLAKSAIGNIYFDGYGIEQDYKEALKWYLLIDEAYYLIALRIGEMYYYGYGVEQDYKEALKWYQKSAEEGNNNSQFNLGLMYYYGYGVEQDYAEALKWYQQATKQDYAEAPKWEQQAVKQGYMEAQCNLGNMYYYGHGTVKDINKARECYELAAQQGDDKAKDNLDLLLLSISD